MAATSQNGSIEFNIGAISSFFFLMAFPQRVPPFELLFQG